MYKLIFADDESLVRSKISQMVEWESQGFSLVGCCANGYELMELVEKELPDVVILDINMPFITGLEAARQIRHSYPHTRLVFLTGYTEFEYAQQAVELGALKYIVKPVGAQELCAALQEAHAALDEENRRVRRMTELEHVWAQSQQVLVMDLLSGAVSGDTLYERARACGLCWSEQTRFQTALFRLDETGRGANWIGTQGTTLLYALCNVTAELAGEAGLGFACARQNLVALVGAAEPDSGLCPRMQECVEDVLHTASHQLQFTVTAGLGTENAGCAHIAVSAKEAMRALEQRVREGGNQMFTANDTQNDRNAAVWDAVNYIEASYADPALSADAVCEYLHLSPSYLRSLFKRQVGSTIIGCITKARMERARTLLADASLKNSRVAELVGYTDPHYFSYCFRRYFGMTPAEMREQLRVTHTAFL